MQLKISERSECNVDKVTETKRWLENTHSWTIHFSWPTQPILPALDLSTRKSVAQETQGPAPTVEDADQIQNFNYRFEINATDAAFKAKFNNVRKVRVLIQPSNEWMNVIYAIDDSLSASGHYTE